jgi:hypothetical protein
MAELPRYQPTGYLPADVPRLDFANIKESVAMTQGISAALDRLSSFAFKEAAETAQREGAQYGVENAPTMEQVLKAQEAGQTPQELFAKPGTYFGDAARKVQAQQVRIDFEAKARQNLDAVSAAIDSGAFDLNQIQTEIKAITTKNGSYRKVLASVDADEALKFSASITSAGNAVYKKATEQYLKLVGMQNEKLVTDSLNSYSTMIADVLKAEQDPTMLAERIKAEENSAIKLIERSTRPEFVKQKRDELQDKIYSNIVDHLIDSSPNATQALLKLQKGDVGNLSELYKGLDKDKLGAMFLKRATEKASALTAAKNIEKVGNETMVNDLLIDYYNPAISATQKREIGLKIAKSRVLSIEQMEKFLNPSPDGDSAVFSNISLQVRTGVITDLNDLRKLSAKSGISGKQLADLSKQLIDRTEKDEGQAAAIIRRNAGLPDVSVGKNKANAHAFAKEAKLTEYYNEAKKAQLLDTGSFDPKSVANVAIQRYENDDKANIVKNNARKNISGVVDSLVAKKKVEKGFVIDETTSLDDLRTRKIIDESQYNYLIGLQTILQAQ